MGLNPFIRALLAFIAVSYDYLEIYASVLNLCARCGRLITLFDSRSGEGNKTWDEGRTSFMQNKINVIITTKNRTVVTG